MAVMLQYIQYWMDTKLSFKEGDESVHIAWIRGVLKDFGTLPEDAGLSRVYDSELTERIKVFQEANKREPTGECDHRTMRDLQRQWVIHGLRDYGILDQLEGTAPKTFYEKGKIDAIH